jgi:hypothetical protein
MMMVVMLIRWQWWWWWFAHDGTKVLKMATHQQVQDYCIPGRLKEVNTRRVYLKILKEKLINGVITRFRFLVSPYLETIGWKSIFPYKCFLVYPAMICHLLSTRNRIYSLRCFKIVLAFWFCFSESFWTPPSSSLKSIGAETIEYAL